MPKSRTQQKGFLGLFLINVILLSYVTTHDQIRVSVKPRPLRIHRDKPTAIVILQKIREDLHKASIAVSPMGR